MKTRNSWMSAALAAVAVTSFGSMALASSHREAPAIANDPAADNTDLYAWVDGGNLTILANYIPLEEPAGGPNFHSFSDDVLYTIHLTRGGASLDDVLVYTIQFKTAPPAYKDPGAAPPIQTPAGGLEFFSQITGASQTYTVTKYDAKAGTSNVLVQNAPVAPPNIGPRTNAIAYQVAAGKTYENTFVDGNATIASLGANEGKVFAGPRDDGFYVDLGAIFDLAGFRALGNPPANGVDNVAGYNTHTIALQIPLSVANGGALAGDGKAHTSQTVGVWAAASRRKVTTIRRDGKPDFLGPWTQVSRLGLPLINEAVIGVQDKDNWNRRTPKDDVAYYGGYFLNPIIVRDAEFAGFYAAGGALAGCADNAGKGPETGRLDIIDVINLKGIPAAGDHDGGDAIPLSATGDVLRVDLGIASGFPNGRPIVPSTNHEQADVTNIELNLLLCKLQVPAAFPWDGVDHNDTNFRATFPYLATPWEGFSQGHGKVQ